MAIVEKIIEIMDWNGIKQKDLAKATGLSKSTISTYLRGVNKISIENAQRIADALGVSLWALLNDEPMAVKPEDISEEESELVGEYRMLSKRSRDLVKSTIETLSDLERKKR